MAKDVVFVRIVAFDPQKTADGDWEIRWRVHLPDDTHRDRRRGGFARKGLADAHAERLALAGSGGSDRLGRYWTLNERLHLVQLVEGESEQPSSPLGPSIWRIVSEWRAATWAGCAPTTRRGHATAWRQALPMLLRDDAPKMPGIVRKYLDDRALRAAVDEAADTAQAREWLDRWSLPGEELTTQRLSRLTTLRGLSRARPALKWAGDRVPGALPSVPSPARDLSSAGAVPTDDEMWHMGWACGLIGGPRWCALAPLVGSAGLRIGEAGDLRRTDLHEDAATGGMWVDVRHIHTTPGRDWTDHGNATEQRRPKGRRGGKPGRRTYVAPAEADVLRTHLATFVPDHPFAYLFVTESGARIDTSHLSRDIWIPARDLAFPAPHRLQGMGRHALRHLAVTRWLRKGVPLTTAARWGGWTRVSTMVDFYDSVLPNDDEFAAGLMAA